MDTNFHGKERVIVLFCPQSVIIITAHLSWYIIIKMQYVRYNKERKLHGGGSELKFDEKYLGRFSFM